MAKRDLHNSISVAASIVPAVQTATVTGSGVDMRDFNSAVVVISTGAIVGAGLFSSKLQESDDNTTFTDVAAIDLLGTPPAALLASTTHEFGYIGSKRYIRPVLTLVSGTSIAAGASVVRGHPNLGPV